MAQLMARLGCARYGAQGGDWGSAVAAWLGVLDKDRVAGIRLNMVGDGPPAGMENPEKGVPQWELDRWRKRSEWWSKENACGSIQGTRPLTPACGLNDSPAGPAARIVEKFRARSDCRGNVESPFSKLPPTQ